MTELANIIWSPLVPIQVIYTLLGLALVTVIYTLFRGIRGTVFRIMVFGALLLILADPSLVIEEREPQKDVVLVMVDQSPSQGLGSRPEQSEAVQKKLEEALKRFERTAEIRTSTYRHTGVADNKRGTSLYKALVEAVADIPAKRFAGAIVVTDGQVHDLPEQIDLAGEKIVSAPIHVLLTGTKNDQDRRLVVVKAPRYGVVGEDVAVTLRIDDTEQTGGNVSLDLKIAGEKTRRMNVPIGRNFELDIPLERRGQVLVSLAVESRAGELYLDNNQALLSINAVRDRLRVLLVSGVPHPGERTWRNLLKADPAVDLVHFTILRPPEKQDGTPIHELSLIAFPTRELFQNKLDEFDLIVFDRYRRRGVLPQIYLRNIVEFVRNGGALLEVVGPGFAGPMSLYRTPMGEIVPGEPTGGVLERGFKPNLTDDGLRHPITARLPGGPVVSLEDELRWGRWFRQVEVRPRGGNVLMSGLEDNPLLVVDRVDEGRVAQLTSDQIWLWARGYEGGGPYAELIRRLAHWLMKEPELEENDLRAYAKDDQLSVEARSMLPIDGVVTIEAPDGVKEDLTLRHSGNGRYKGGMTLSQSGVYKVSDGKREVLVASGGMSTLEMSEVVSTDKPLKPIADESEGSIRWAGDNVPDIGFSLRPGGQFAQDKIILRKNDDYITTGLRVVSLLPVWVSLIAVMVLLVLTWRREAE